MQKIPTLFQRGDDWLVTDTVTPGCEWVLEGRGYATVKYDGTPVMLEGGVWYRRRTVANQDGVLMPSRFIESGRNSRKIYGWVPVSGTDLEPLLLEAITQVYYGPQPSTYELCGPKVNGNKQEYDNHRLFIHNILVRSVPTGFKELREFMTKFAHEGVVWYGLDGERAKLKRTDFGLEW